MSSPGAQSTLSPASVDRRVTEDDGAEAGVVCGELEEAATAGVVGEEVKIGVTGASVVAARMVAVQLPATAPLSTTAASEPRKGFESLAWQRLTYTITIKTVMATAAAPAIAKAEEAEEAEAVDAVCGGAACPSAAVPVGDGGCEGAPLANEGDVM